MDVGASGQIFLVFDAKMSYTELETAAKADNVENVLGLISRMNVREKECYQKIRSCLINHKAYKSLREFIRDVKYCRIHRFMGYRAGALLEDLELVVTNGRGTLNHPSYFK